MRLKTMFKSLFYLSLFLIVAGFTVFVLFGLENTALVKEQSELSTENIKRASRQFIKEHDPDTMKADRKNSFSVKEQDLNLVFHYALSLIPGGKSVGTRVDIEPGSAHFSSTFKLPKNSFRSYCNLSVGMSHVDSGLPNITTVKIGKIILNRWLIKTILPVAHSFLGQFAEYQDVIEITGSIRECQFTKNQLSLSYDLQSGVAEKIKEKGRKMLISEQEGNRLKVYHERLSTVTADVSGKKISLSLFIEPLFTLAKERSGRNQEPILENRAAITVLALFTLKKPLNLLTGEKGERVLSTSGSIQPTLRGRADLAKHFILSAAISASADSSLADAIGLFKELDDSQGGSGFSFADLTADRAGVRFAEFATADSGQAIRLQELISSVSGEDDFMPRIDNLPEGIQEFEFKIRYEDLQSNEYAAVKDELERRISACRVYQ